MCEEIKLPKMKSPENAKEDKKGKKEELVKEKGTTKEKGITWWRKWWRGSSNLVEDIILSPPNKPDRITHRQNKVSGTRPYTAPDEAKEGPDKTIDDTVAMATYTRDKDGAGSRQDKTCVEGRSQPRPLMKQRPD